MQTRNVYVVAGKRSPFVKSMRKYQDVSSQDLLTASLKDLVSTARLKDKMVGDVALGAIMNSSTNWNIARESVLGTDLSPYTPAYNLQRACGTGLEAALQIALKIANYQIEDGIAGGVDTNSDLPIEVSSKYKNFLLGLNNAKSFGAKLSMLLKISPSFLKPKIPAVVEPRTGLSMGEHCEKMVKEWGISREAQDQLAYESHQKAAAAYDEGFHDDLVFNFKGLNRDTITRKDTTIQKLASLKPAFDKSAAGTLTAGNSTPLTDGSSVVLLASEEACKKNNWTPQAIFKDAEVAAVDFVHGDGLLMAPTIAVGRLLARNNLKLQDFDYYEIHEAFAGQVLCTLKAWEDKAYCKKYLGIDEPLGSIDRSKMNVKGGSLALGHPFAATGGRIIASLAKLLYQTKKKRGLISICTAGGMGVAAIIEGI
ncbi:MAG: acetyl-CoA C-acetyltransferase [Bdellovibrionales bacterium]|nr:acetyl-CoA C-acetyltransferase [Bdellovibrionales bacterium]